MTKRVIDLRTPEEKAAWIANKKIEDAAMAEGVESITEADATGTCPKCNNPADDEDTCPFHLEIHDDDSLCACCDDCRQQCALDI